MDEARRIANNIAKLPNYLAERIMADDGMTKLSKKLVPLLREYDLPDIIMALTFQLSSAIDLASKATKIGDDLQTALEYAEQKTFWINDAIKKILRGT